MSDWPDTNVRGPVLSVILTRSTSVHLHFHFFFELRANLLLETKFRPNSALHNQTMHKHNTCSHYPTFPKIYIFRNWPWFDGDNLTWVPYK